LLHALFRVETDCNSRTIALRLHPIPVGHARVAQNDTILPVGGGPSGLSPVFVGAGWTVATQGSPLHRSRATFGADADEFRPERWAECRPRWGYIPFGGGPRTCPAQQVALKEASAVLVRMAGEVEKLESRDDRAYEELVRLTVGNRNGVLIGLER
jgi:cytochrome P450